MLSPLPPAIGQQRFPSKLVRRNHKNAVCVGVADVNDFQVATAPRPANGYAGTVPSRTIFPGIPQDFFYLFLFLFHVVITDMRLTRGGIEIETQIHYCQYRR